jgi:hypothetical protein
VARLVTWERYVPDFEDNRARWARDPETALTVMLRPPTEAVWRRFWLAIATASTPHTLPPHLADLAVSLSRTVSEDADAQRRVEQQVRDGLTLYVATLDPALAEILWMGCVGAVRIPPGLIEGLEHPEHITTGEALWALRDRLDSFALYQDILEASITRARLEAGLAAFLPSPSASSASRPPADALRGTAGTAAREA